MRNVLLFSALMFELHHSLYSHIAELHPYALPVKRNPIMQHGCYTLCTKFRIIVAICNLLKRGLCFDLDFFFFCRLALDDEAALSCSPRERRNVVASIARLAIRTNLVIAYECRRQTEDEAVIECLSAAIKDTHDFPEILR